MSLGLSHPLWKAADITTPMQCYKSSHTMLWLYFGLLPFLFQHRNQGFLNTLCYIMEVVTVFSYLVFGHWLRKILGENSEIKCSGRSFLEIKCRWSCILIVCLGWVVLSHSFGFLQSAFLMCIRVLI